MTPENLSSETSLLLIVAQSAARSFGQNDLGASTFLASMSSDGPHSTDVVRELFQGFGVAKEEVVGQIAKKNATSTGPKNLDEIMFRIFDRAKVLCDRLREEKIKPEHLLYEILRDRENGACEILTLLGIDISQMQTRLEEALGMAPVTQAPQGALDRSRHIPGT